jgi:hypothetical protein
MSDREHKEFMKKFKELEKRLLSDPAAARKFLVDAGIFTSKGNLRKPYRNLYIPPDPA